MSLITYTLMVDDLPVSMDVIEAVEDIEVESDATMASILRLRLRISLDNSGARWTVLDNEVFTLLAGVRLLVTIGASLPEVLFDGYVTETEATLTDAESGSSWLNVIAMDATAVMNLEEQAREFPNLTDSLIAMQIFAEHGLVPIADPTMPPRIETATTVIQRDTDIRFLRDLAARNGFDVFVQPSPVPGVVEGHFHPPRVDFPPQGVINVAMPGVSNAWDFVVKNEMLRPATSSAGGVAAGSVEAQNVEQQSTQVTELGRQSLHQGDRPRRLMMQPAGLSETGELQSAVQGEVDRSTWAVTVTCTISSFDFGKVVRPGAAILVRGAGTTISGAYYVERVLHSFEGERHGWYTQQLTLRRNALAPTGLELYLDDAGLPV